MYAAYAQQPTAAGYPMAAMAPQQAMMMPMAMPMQMQMAPPVNPRDSPMSGSDENKVFIGGLLPTTSSAALSSYFTQFGPVVEARVVVDKLTGQSKRYAFICFSDPESATRAAAPGHHVIEGKQCNVNLVSQKDVAIEAYRADPANAAKRAREGESGGDDGGGGGEQKRRRTSEVTSSAVYSPYTAYAASYGAAPGYGMPQGYPGAMAGYPPAAPALAGRPGDPKIFVGNLAGTTTDELLTMMLSVFGDVAESHVIRDLETNESKGFAFVTFVDPGAAARAATCGVLFIEGRRCTTNLASAKGKK